MKAPFLTLGITAIQFDLLTMKSGNSAIRRTFDLAHDLCGGGETLIEAGGVPLRKAVR